MNCLLHIIKFKNFIDTKVVLVIDLTVLNYFFRLLLLKETIECSLLSFRFIENDIKINVPYCFWFFFIFIPNLGFISFL